MITQMIGSHKANLIKVNSQEKYRNVCELKLKI